MSAAQPEPSRPTAAELVEDWRETILRKAGFPADDAIELSRRTDVDLHQAVGLLRAGCDPSTAAEILR